jgi:hypothetical protein
MIPVAAVAILAAMYFLGRKFLRDGSWHPNFDRMRRLGPDGKWQYRAMTRDEQSDEL